YSRASQGGATTITHKPMLDATLRYGFPWKLLVSDRNRFELRWVNSKPDFRYRNRLLLERPMKISVLKLSPFGGAEAYWDDRFTKGNLFRFTGGMEVPLVRRLSMDVRFERQHC